MVADQTSTACNTSPVAGNRCIACSNAGSNYTCPGGTSCPVLNTVSCGGGKYLPAYKSSASDCTTCEAGYYCPGGDYNPNSSSVQGRYECGAYEWSYAGAASCSGCPVDPLDGNRGNFNDDHTSPYGCWKGASSTSVNIGLDTTYTTATANCYWNGSNYALGGSNTHGCDAYRITACAARYYDADPSSYAGHTCSAVGTGYYSAAGSVSRSACTNKPSNSYYTSDGTNNDCAWGCNTAYYKSGSTCYSCTGVSLTESGTDTTTDTSGCTSTSQTVTGSVSGGGSYKQAQTRSGSRTGTRSMSRTCYRTGGAGGTNGASACTGSGNCGAWGNYGAWSYGSCSYTAWSNSGSRLITCPAGTYWNGSGCAGCETGYYCPGFTDVSESNLSNGYGRGACSNKPDNSSYSGSATSNACPWSCNAGYYGSSANGNTSCADCGSGNYCTGGTHRATCASTVKAGSPTPSNIISLSSGSWSDYNHGASAGDCICDWVFSDETRTQYLNEGACSYGPTGNNYTNYEWCRTGYYAADPLNWGNWYTSCKACTNKPANSTYTGRGTPSVMYAVEDNCPWECNSGYNLTSDGQCAQLCTAGITILRLGENIRIPLYSAKHTEHVIGIGYNGNVCYGNLAAGTAAGTLNVNINGNKYHAIQ